MGALLGLNLVVAVALLAAGLVWGGPWRQMPTGWSWAFTQKLEVRAPLCPSGSASGAVRVRGSDKQPNSGR